MLALAMIICFGACGKKEEPAPADKGPECYVTIVKGDGEFAIAHQTVNMVDYDNNGSYNIDEVLRAAHAQYGNEADYASAEGEYGLGLTKLWGDESQAFGYYVAHEAAMSLADPVLPGFTVEAFIYQDKVGFSDAYSYIESAVVMDGILTVHVCKIGFDETWAPVTQDAEGAEVFLDGTSLGTTDAEGKVTYKLGSEKNFQLTARGEGLVPAVCEVAIP